MILWLVVPSKAIRTQTMAALKDRDHPYHAALREAGPVEVMDLDEAKSLNRSMLESGTVVIVATRQAFQVGDEEMWKVYEDNGVLMELVTNKGNVCSPWSRTKNGARWRKNSRAELRRRLGEHTRPRVSSAAPSRRSGRKSLIFANPRTSE